MNVLVLDCDGVVNNDSSIEQNTKLHTILGEVETSLYDLIPESITNEI